MEVKHLAPQPFISFVTERTGNDEPLRSRFLGFEFSCKAARHTCVVVSGRSRGETNSRGKDRQWDNLNKTSKAKKNMKKLILLAALLAIPAVCANAADAKATYEKDCTKCHGADGKGETKMGKKMGAKDYTDAKVQAEMKDDAAFKAIKEGLKDKEGKVLMKPAEDLSDADIKALVAYMRTFKK